MEAVGAIYKKQMIYLHLNWLAIDKFNARNKGVEYHWSLFAGVEGDGVDFSFYCDCGVCTPKQIYYVVHLGVFYQ